MDKLLGWFFRAFNRFFGPLVGRLWRRRASGDRARPDDARGLCHAGRSDRRAVQGGPGGFVPGQDKQYLVGFAQLPDAATLDRTEDVIRRMSEIALKHPGVENAVSFPGLSINGFTNSSNSGIVFVGLKPFDQRKDPSLSGNADRACS
jgi:multidrug efflux pump